MNKSMLIDAIVRQTMVLIARLATSGGQRIPLDHLANQVFVELTRELRSQNVRAKVISDMFGLSLRAYYTKAKRLTETHNERSRTVWQSVVSFLTTQRTTTRAELLKQFTFDDQSIVVSILSDLVDSGFLSRSGSGPRTTYRMVEDSFSDDDHGEGLDSVAAFLWLLVFRLGPITEAELLPHFPSVDASTMANILDRLEIEGKIARHHGDGDRTFTSLQCVLPLEQREAADAAMFDHFQAMVNVIAQRSEQPTRSHSHLIGGSTFHFEVDEAHPLYNEVLSMLQNIRTTTTNLRSRVDQYNRERSDRPNSTFQVILYAGQNVIAD